MVETKKAGPRPRTHFFGHKQPVVYVNKILALFLR